MTSPRLPFSLGRLRGRRARMGALGISLALHALLAVGLFFARPTRGPLALDPHAPLEVEILTEAPAELPATEDGTVSTPPGPAPATEEAATPVSPRPPKPARPIARGEAGAPATPPAPGTGTPGEATADGEGVLVEPGALRMRFPPPTLALGPTFDQLDRLSREGGIAPPDPRVAVPERPRSPTFSERLAERVKNDASRENVTAGKVHPQMYEFLRDARRGFVPAPEALDADPRAPNTVARSLKQWGRGVGNAMKSWQRKLDDPKRLRLDHDPNRRGAPDILEHYNRMMNGTETAAEPMDCLVCLVIRPGAPPEVVLAGTSGNAEVDRAAMEALRRSTNTRPLDPDVKSQKSCYRFRATVHRIPPLPIVGCGFDEASLTAGCYYPTMKVRKTTVHLESVDYDG